MVAFEPERRKKGKMAKIKCHSCDGKGFWHEIDVDNNKVAVICLECSGKGYVLMERFEN